MGNSSGKLVFLVLCTNLRLEYLMQLSVNVLHCCLSMRKIGYLQLFLFFFFCFLFLFCFLNYWVSSTICLKLHQVQSWMGAWRHTNKEHVCLQKTWLIEKACSWRSWAWTRHKLRLDKSPQLHAPLIVKRNAIDMLGWLCNHKCATFFFNGPCCELS